MSWKSCGAVKAGSSDTAADELPAARLECKRWIQMMAVNKLSN